MAASFTSPDGLCRPQPGAHALLEKWPRWQALAIGVVQNFLRLQADD
jgi:hypothetical protein